MFSGSVGLLFVCYRRSASREIKRLGRESDHDSPPRAKFENAASYILNTPQYILISWCLVKHWDSFTILRCSIFEPFYRSAT